MSDNDLPFDDEAGFDFSASIADDLLGDDVQPDFTPEFPANDVGDLSAAAPIREKSEEEVLAEVEDSLLALLGQERRSDLLVLTGELPDTTSSVDDEVSEEFGSLYTQAVLINPALKWYGKLAKVLSPEQFHLDGEQLHLSIGRELFKKIIGPFISDFKADFEDSPIVAVVRNLAKQTGDLEAKESEARIQKDRAFKAVDEDGQFDPSGVDFNADEDGNQDIADLDIGDDIFSDPEQQTDTATLKISMRDLSAKAVAEYCDSENMSTDEIPGKLQDEGFSRAQANEIAGIVKYMRLDRKLKKGKAEGHYIGAELGFNPFA